MVTLLYIKTNYLNMLNKKREQTDGNIYFTFLSSKTGGRTLFIQRSVFHKTAFSQTLLDTLQYNIKNVNKICTQTACNVSLRWHILLQSGWLVQADRHQATQT